MAGFTCGHVPPYNRVTSSLFPTFLESVQRQLEMSEAQQLLVLSVLVLLRWEARDSQNSFQLGFQHLLLGRAQHKAGAAPPGAGGAEGAVHSPQHLGAASETPPETHWQLTSPPGMLQPSCHYYPSEQKDWKTTDMGMSKQGLSSSNMRTESAIGLQESYFF